MRPSWRLWLGLALGLTLFENPGEASERPNIVLIHVDDLGYGDLGSYGQKKFRTPQLDRLAREGARFTQYYAGSAVCAPSRAVLMTGRHTGHVSVRGNGDVPLPAEDVTVGEVLKQAGYATAMVGKWGLGVDGTTGQPDRQGFDETFGVLHHIHAHRQYTDHLWHNGRWVKTNPRAYTSDLYVDAARTFMRQNRRRPFFLYLALPVPHAELRVPEDSLKEYRGKFPETPHVNPKADNTEQKEPWQYLGYRSQPHPRAAFAAMMARLDRHVGEIVAELKRQKLDRRTIVIFTSDNGPHLEGGITPEYFDSSGGLRGAKRDLYEGGIRVPMIVRWPGRIAPGTVSDAIWAHWDLLPTFADLAGAAAPADIDGVSMKPVLEGGKAPERAAPLYWEFHERGFHQAVRQGKWKAVRHGLRAPLELYDLEADRAEQHDVAARNPEVVASLRAQLDSSRSEPTDQRWKVSAAPAREGAASAAASR